MNTASMMARWLFTILILVQIGFHAHWSVTLFAVLMSIRAEVQDATKRIRTNWKSGISIFGWDK